MASLPPSTRLAPALKSFSRVASALVVLVGCLVLLGWALDVTVLKSVVPGLATMAPNSALAFVLAGASLGLSLASPSDRRPSRAARACALAVTLIGLLSLSEYVFGWNLGIDEVLFRDPRAESGLPRGRMAPAASLGFVLVGFALLGLTLEGRRSRLAAQSLAVLAAVLAAVLGLVALAGYLYGARSLYTFGPYASMSLHTAGLFVVLSAGILAAQPTVGLMAQVTSDSAGGFLVRRLLPVMVGVPLMLGWLALAGEQAGLYESTVRLSLTVVSSIIVLTATVLWSARSLHLVDVERKRADEALRASETHLKRAQEIAHLGSWELDLTGNRLTWSDEAYRIFGLQPQEFGATYEAFLDHVHPDDRAAVDAAYTDSLRENRDTYEIEHRVVRQATGEVRFVHEKCEHYRDATGRIVRSVGMVHDITERKRVEEALRASEEQLRQFVQSVPAAVAMFDTEMRYLVISRRWLTDYHLGERDIVGLSHYEVFPDIPERWKEIHRRCLAGATEKCEDDPFERSDGAIEWISWEIQPWRNSRGEIGGIIMFTDVTTERKRAQAERERLLAELEATLEAAPVGVAIFDPSGNLIRTNAAAVAMAGYPPAELALPLPELLAKLRFEAADGRPLPLEECPADRALHGERVAGTPVAFHRGDRKVWILDASAPIRARDGSVLGAVSSFVDITELRELQERQRQLFSQLESRAAELAFERDRLRTVVESIADAVFVCDAQGTITLANAAGLALMGEPSDARRTLADYLSALQLRYPDGRPVPLEELAITRALGGVTVRGQEEVGVHPRTHEQVHLLVSAAPLRDADGRLVGAVEVAADITAVKRAEEAVRQSGELLRAIVDNSPAAIYLKDLEGRLLLVNDVFQGLFARSREEVTGKLDREFMPEDAAQAFRANDRRVVESGVPMQFEEVLPLADGPHTYLSEKFPVRDARGIIYATGGVSTDVTERKRAEAERERLLVRMEELAQESQRRAAELLAVLDNMVDAVFVVDAAGRITLTNAAATRLLGLPSFERGGRMPAELPSLLHLRHFDGRPIEPREMATARALAGETVVNMDQVLHNRELDQDRYVRVSAAPIRDAEGKVVAAVIVVRDVTELTELDRLKDQFISVAAHELKTPVAAMQGYAQVLMRTASSAPPQWRRMLEAIDRGAHRIDAVVMDLLDVSRLQAGQLELTMGRVDLPALVGEVVDRLALTAPRHRVRVVSADPVVVQGDRDRLEQVLVNLIDNAVRYSPAGGDVDVAVTVRGREAVVSVKDQGVGIPKEKQGSILQRFYRAHTDTPYDYGGMGVGLYISNEIVRRHDGRMWFESQEGRGSTFYFSLPLEGGETRSSRGERVDDG